MKNRMSNREPENPVRTERVILAVYIFYSLCMLIFVPLYRDLRMLLPLLAGISAGLWLLTSQYGSYLFRAFVISGAMWLNLLLYALFTDDFTGMLISVAAVIMLQTLYCVPELFSVGCLSYTVMVLAHLLIFHDLQLALHENGVRMLLRILAIYFIMAIARYLVVQQQNSNQRLLSNIESLRAAERAKDDFMANISHEIRTPVNTICGMSEIVLQQELSEEAHSRISDIQMAGRSLYSIVSDILDFSELQSGNVTILRDTYNITSVVNDIINMTSAKNSEKNLELIVDCDPNMPNTMIGDRQKLCRTVMNVIGNAIKYTEAGGVVFSMTTRKESYGVNLCITVQDTGIGIRPENLEQIFTSFYQVDTRRNRADGGMGLGLPISRAIAEKMGGFLNIRSSYGEGTGVTIVIPQGVEDESPCISLKNPDSIHILIYHRAERLKYPLLREGYRQAVKRMMLTFDRSARFCKNLQEVKLWLSRENVTHLFVGQAEYEEDSVWFEAMAEQLQVTLISESSVHSRKPDRLLCVHAPFYALTIASILNGESFQELASGVHRYRFTAPDVHVLVVDDNLMNLKVVEGLLRPYRLKISAAQSGPEALKKIECKAYDFIFMDHMMPEMDGVETFRRIREKPGEYFQKVPVIALTANAVGDAREMFLAEGFSDYIAKPIEMTAMEHVLRKFIPRGKMLYEQDRKDPGETAGGNGCGNAEEHLRSNADESIWQTDVLKETLSRFDVDAKTGEAYCGGSRKDYLEILNLYLRSGERQIDGVQKACAEQDRENYVILMHTIKSTSRSIGASGLSDMAARLEAAGKGNEELSALDELKDAMLTEYRKVLQGISEAISVGEQKISPASAPSVPGEKEVAPAAEEKKALPPPTGVRELTALEFAACCQRLSVKLDTFDSDAVTNYLDRLGDSRYRGMPLSELLRPVLEKVEDFDFMGAEEELTQLREQERRP